MAVLVSLLLQQHASSSPCQPPTSEPTVDTTPAGDGDGSGSPVDDAGLLPALGDEAATMVASGGDLGLGVERTAWVYAPRQTDKADCGYVGLQNLGATCYMNSLLQQLFMVPALRFGVLSCDPFYRTEEEKAKGIEAVPREENLLYQLQVGLLVEVMSRMDSWESSISFILEDRCKLKKPGR